MCLLPDERAKWRLFRLFPAFLPTTRFEDLTEEEVWWFLLQANVDDGYGRCTKCREPGWGPHCGACGVRFEEEHVPCGSCEAEVRTSYCTRCGEPTEDARLFRSLRRGETYDYAQIDRETNPPVTAAELSFLGEVVGLTFKDPPNA